MLLQCSNLLLMPCAIPSKAISAVQYCHLDKGLCEVEGRWLKADGQMEQWTHIQSNLHPLTKAFKVTKMKKPNQNLEVPLLPFPHKQHLHSFLCFSPPPFFLFLSLSLSSPCIVSLIGRQTACKCSNPEKSPGALVIGCALQHCSQSIKAR